MSRYCRSHGLLVEYAAEGKDMGQGNKKRLGCSTDTDELEVISYDDQRL